MPIHQAAGHNLPYPTGQDFLVVHVCMPGKDRFNAWFILYIPDRFQCDGIGTLKMVAFGIL